MHLLCQDTECVGNDLPAGSVEDDECRFCGKPLMDERGNVLAHGAVPLVDGNPPASFNALMDALRDAGTDVRVVELSAVRQGDKLLVSALAEDGVLESVGILEGEAAGELNHVLDLMGDRGGSE